MGMRVALGLASCLVLSCAFASPRIIQHRFLITPGLVLNTPDTRLSVDSYPQALPNDGRSESTISVQILSGDSPAAGLKVEAKVAKGDGWLPRAEAVTDERGVATFTYRAGFSPTAGEVSLKAVESGAEAQLKIPLAPVSYLDLLVLTPEEYQKQLDRQTRAAPIYKLEASAFPEQLAADGGSLSMVTATLRMADGKPAPGVVLTAKLISGDGALSPRDKCTDTTGKMSFYFTAGRLPGTVTIQITEPSTGLNQALNLLLVEAGPCRIELYYQDKLFGLGLAREGGILPADGMATLPLVAKVTDLSGLPLAGIGLRIETLTDTGGWLEVLDETSDAAGELQFAYHAGTTPGPVRIRAFAASGLKLSGTMSNFILPEAIPGAGQPAGAGFVGPLVPEAQPPS